MINIEEIIQLIKPLGTQIINNTIVINEPIQIDTLNQRNDVLMWVSEKNVSIIPDIKHGTIICPIVDSNILQENCNYIFTDKPRSAFGIILKTFFSPALEYHIATSAQIASSAKIGAPVSIGHNVVIEDNCVIGNNVIIGHNTIIHKNSILRDNVTIGCNTVIGGVGFGYEKDDNGEYCLIPHIGNVVIEEFVEIGNCTTIDRAVMGSTILKKNVKVDNLVHIAHGVEIGQNSLIIANAMIGGSTKIGENVWVAPSSSIINKVSIGDNSLLGMGAVVIKTVASNTVVIGNPAKPLDKKQ